jgi:hypothetical protein
MKYICLYFARGCCPYGYECNYRHSLPDPYQVLPDTAKDCFARDKFADYRDDMGGVGSFQRENRTLYIGRIKETGAGPETEEIVRRHFAEWGEIDRCKYHLLAFTWMMLTRRDSTRAAIPRCSFRDLRTRSECSICSRSYVVSKHG